MKSLVKKLSSIFIFGMIFTFYACSDDPASPDVDGSEAVIHGSVVGNSSDENSQLQSSANQVEGATVTAARITSEGSFETIADTETETDASGEFTLFVDVTEAQHIAVIAETETEQWAGFLSAQVENDNSYTLKPIDAESSAETEVYSRLVASGDANIVRKSDIQAVITSQNAAEVTADGSAAAEFATGLANAAEARAAFIADKAGENADEIREEALRLSAEAQFQLESELAAASSAEQREAAIETFMEAVVDTYAEAGLDVSSAAKTIEIWGRSFVNSVSSVATEIKNDSRAALSMMIAIAIDKAVQTEAEAAGKSQETIEAIVDAGIQLKSEIEASGGAEADIDAAFESYHDEVRTAMENDGSVEASVIIAIDADINATGGYKSIFETAISGTLSADLLVEAYNTFFSSVESSVESHMEEADESQVEAVAQLMILINLAS